MTGKVHSFAINYFRVTIAGLAIAALAALVTLSLGLPIVALTCLGGVVLCIALVAHSRLQFKAQLCELTLAKTLQYAIRCLEKENWRACNRSLQRLKTDKMEELICLLRGTALINLARKVKKDKERQDLVKEAKELFGKYDILTQAERVALDEFDS